MKQVIAIDLLEEKLFTKDDIAKLIASLVEGLTLEDAINELGDRVQALEVDVPISALIEELGADEALSEFDNSDIIDHLEGQGYSVIEGAPETMFDQMKMDFFVQNADKISLEALEQIV